MAMFEVGRSYKVTTREGDDTVYTTAEVLEVEGSLVKFKGFGNHTILNTASPTFISATPNDDKAKREEAEAAEQFRNSVKIHFVEGDDQL